MHPALSVIFFTTLSGAGYGLLAWLGLSLALLQRKPEVMASLQTLQLWALGLGLALSIAGLLSSLGHLGKPQRAWRALSQWRTSWLSREGVLALATMLPAVAIGATLQWIEPAEPRMLLLGAAGLLLALLALATVACTAMIYASLPPIPAWRHALVVPVYLLFAMLTGLALLFVLMALRFGIGGNATEMLALLSAFGAVLLVAKLLYWRDIDRASPSPTRGDAVGLPGRTVEVFERPHTEQNFITREMAFAVARRHAGRLRLLAGTLVAGVPLLALALAAAGIGPAMAWLCLATAAVLAGAFVERWLFFAQARHLVTLYY